MTKLAALLAGVAILLSGVPAARAALPGCETSDSPGCGGCACEACVCENDPFCCETAWDGLCVDACISECDGAATCYPNCGNGACDAGEGETCSTCEADCACPDGQSCYDDACCAGDCNGKECGGDGCGGYCGDCADNLECNEAGQCQECQPKCEGMQCGWDGCDGECGVCPEGQLCNWENQCEECAADCGDAVCGDDGCGGSCGECPEGLSCAGGACAQLNTCENRCDNYEGDAECQCDSACEEFGDCCEDICNFCPEMEQCGGCTADCTDKSCLDDDGCGGICGCEGELQCCGDGTCKADCGGDCVPDCNGKSCAADNGCGVVCGCDVGLQCCEDGACLAECAGGDPCAAQPCTPGELGCDGALPWSCTQGADGCGVMTPGAPCAEGWSCQAGVCLLDGVGDADVGGGEGDITSEPGTGGEGGGGGGGGGGSCSAGPSSSPVTPLLVLLLVLLAVPLRRRLEQ